MLITVSLVASVFSFIYYVLGSEATWISFFFYLSLPLIVCHDTFVRHVFFMHKLRVPFSNLRNVKDFGINGGRYIKIKFKSVIDERDIEIAIWHILPQSLVEQFESLSGSPEEINNFFDDQLKKSQKPIVIYNHGVSRTVSQAHRRALYKILQRLDMHIVAYDYRGYGDSTSVKPTRMGLVEDLLSIYSWVKNVSGDSPIFLWGHSLGTGITLKAMSRLEEYSSILLNLEKPLPYPKGIMLESAFSRVVDAVEDLRYIDFLYLIPFAKKYITNVYRTNPDVRLDSLKYVEAIKNVPLLMMHAQDDDIISSDMGRKLFKAAKDSRTDKDAPAEFVEFSAGQHMWLCLEKEFPDIVSKFVNLHK